MLRFMSGVPYTANLLGGVMQGVSFAKTKASSETVIVQAAMGRREGWFVLLGAVVGGVGFVRFGEGWKGGQTGNKNVKGNGNDKMKMLDENVGARLGVWVVGFVVVLGMGRMREGGLEEWRDVVWAAALLLGSQVVSVVLTGRMLGVSSVYEDLGKVVWKPGDRVKRVVTSNSVILALGIFAGAACGKASGYGVWEEDMENELDWQRVLLLLLAGCIMSFGARLAGGCTSGHGLSGMASSSISSSVTMGGMVIGYLVTSLLLPELTI